MFHPELRQKSEDTETKGKQITEEEGEIVSMENGMWRHVYNKKQWNPTHRVFARRNNTTMNDIAKTPKK